MRRIGVVTSSRADFGIYRPILREISSDPSLALDIVATGMHLSTTHDYSIEEIQRDGFHVHDTVACSVSTDSPQGMLHALGDAVRGFADLFIRWTPDILMVLGDRFDMYPAALAALPFRIPVAHVHGGEVTTGAIDDALRHSMTKLAHLHFVSTREYAGRVAQLGEEDWRITVCGAPALDNLLQLDLPSDADIARHFGWDSSAKPLLITFHSTTLAFEQAGEQVKNLLAALCSFSGPIVFTAPNSDPGGLVISEAIHAFVATRSNAHFVANLGTRMYFGVMRSAAAMVGNSSSGLIEAASFHLPVVNIGTRQQGRVRGANVIDVGSTQSEIEIGLSRALAPSFRAAIADLENPYYHSGAAKIIVDVLKRTTIDERLTTKPFVDHPGIMG
jgi:UDP-hydrolysing UDP-N-acetyl-D-glucosamine 2-epimerase